MGSGSGLTGTVVGTGDGVGVTIFLVLREGLVGDKGNGLIGWGVEGENGWMGDVPPRRSGVEASPKPNNI